MKRSIALLFAFLILFTSLPFLQSAQAQLPALSGKVMIQPFKEVTKLAFAKLIPGVESALVEKTVTSVVVDEIFPRAYYMSIMGASGAFSRSNNDPRITFLTDEDVLLIPFESGSQIPLEFHSSTLSHTYVSAQLILKTTEALKLAGNNEPVDGNFLWLGILNGLMRLPEKMIRAGIDDPAMNGFDMIGLNHSLLLGISSVVSSGNSLIKHHNSELIRLARSGARRVEGNVNPNRFFYNRLSGLGESLERAIVLAYIYHTQIPGILSYPDGLPKEMLKEDLLIITAVLETLGLKTAGFLKSARASIVEDPINYLELTKMRVLEAKDMDLRQEVSNFEKLPLEALKKSGATKNR